MANEQRMVEVSPELAERIMNTRWFIYVCAEPDGQDCSSGTHPNILSHKCAALRRWHEAMAARAPGDLLEPDDPGPPGPLMVVVEVAAVPPEDLSPLDEAQ